MENTTQSPHVGIYAVNEPKGITSHDVVAKIGRATGVKRVGHGGTLDPLAHGVLVIAVGREYTKQLDTFVKGEKEYKAIIKLGFHSSTDDEEGDKTPGTHPEYIPSSEELDIAINSFKGYIQQTPPIYSALKIDGVAAYRRARRRENIEMSPRTVKIYDIKTISYQYPYVTINVVTGPGVYIRALARDIGSVLQTGAYLYDLERTKVGKFTISDCKSLDELIQSFSSVESL